MTLFRQLMLFVLLLFVFTLGGTLYVTFHQARNYYLQQLEVSAQDTATSLGLSLSQHAQDKETMLSMVNAIFDSGSFIKIELMKTKGKPIISRFEQPTYQKIPKWFLKMVEMTIPEKSAVVLSGWKQLGVLTVVSDPSLAYFDLWNTSIKLLIWFLCITSIFILLAYFGTKILFRPLKRVAQQAEYICANVFHVDLHLPRTKELRVVADAMNKTVTKLKSIFAEQAHQISDLQKKTYQDPLTKVGNREFFEEQLQHSLTSEDAYKDGHLLFLDIQGLKNYNNRCGYQKGDQRILEACHTLQDLTKKLDVQFVTRIAGATFAFIILGLDEEEIESICTVLLSKLRALWLNLEVELSACIGGSAYHYEQDRKLLLSATDQALTHAINEGHFKFDIAIKELQANLLSTADWKTLLEEALNHDSLSLFCQVVEDDKGKLFHEEIFTKLQLRKQVFLSAGQYIPMAEKLHLTDKIDLYVLDKVVNLARKTKKAFSINLSSTIVHSSEKREALLSKLKKDSFSNYIHFEISESVVTADLQTSEKFIDAMNQLNYVVGLDKVGSSLSPLLYLTSLKVRYLKIDGSLIRDIFESKSKQFFVKNLKHATDTLSIKFIATNIETSEELSMLKKLGVNWFQGNYISKVKKC